MTRRTKAEIEADRLEAFNQLSLSGGLFEVCKQLFTVMNGRMYWLETMEPCSMDDFINSLDVVYKELKKWFKVQKLDIDPMKEIDFKHFEIYFGDSITYAIVKNEIERVNEEDED